MLIKDKVFYLFTILSFLAFNVKAQEFITQPIDSINNSTVDSLLNIQSEMVSVEDTILSPLDSVASDYNSAVDSVDKIDNKLNVINSDIKQLENSPDKVEYGIDKPLNNTEERLDNKLSLKSNSFKVDEMQIQSDGVGVKDFLPVKELPTLKSKLDLPEVPDIKELPRLDLSKTGNLKAPDQDFDLVRKYLPEGMKDQADEINELYSKSHSGKDIDQYIDSQALNMDQTGEFQKMNGEMTGVNAGLASLSALDKLRVKEAMKNDKIKTKALHKLTEKGQEYMTDHLEQLPDAKEKMMKLKKKYSYVGSMSDLKGAEKKNSLKDEPLRKRIVLGGNMQIRRADPLSLDMEPNLGYRFNKKLSAGISWTYRFALVYDTKYMFKIPERMYGYGVYGSYKIFKGFFGHLEFQSNCMNIKHDDLSTTKEWVNGLMVGIGNEYRIYKSVHGTVILMYNTLHKSDSYDPRPWQVKFGININ